MNVDKDYNQTEKNRIYLSLNSKQSHHIPHYDKNEAIKVSDKKVTKKKQSYKNTDRQKKRQCPIICI